MDTRTQKKDASTDTCRCSDCSKVRRRSGTSMSVRIATRKRTAAFALAKFRSQGIAASSFVFEMGTSYVRSPMLAPAVARWSSRRKRPEDYRSNTRSLMGKLVQQPCGSGSDVCGDPKQNHRGLACGAMGGRCRHFFPPSRVHFPSGGHASETAEPQQDSGPTGCHLVGRAGAV